MYLPRSFLLGITIYSSICAASPLASIERRGVANVNTWDYFGCYREADFTRALRANSFDSSALTVEQCATFCNGYAYFGVEYGTECYCGARIEKSSAPFDEVYCDFTCAGNANQQCGGRNMLNMYKKRVGESGSPTPTPAPAAPVSYAAVGCYTDSTGNRALKGAKFVDDGMTVEKCASSCKGWALFGVEYAFECFCGSRLEQSSEVVTSQCNMPCRGNSAQFCGAGDRLNVYRYEVSSVTTSTSAVSSTSSATSSPSPIPEVTNPLVNGGFENGLGPWVITDIRTSGALTTSFVHTGATAYKVSQSIEGADPEIKVGGIRQFVSIIPGRSYRFKLWSNRLSGQCSIDVYLANKRISAFWYAYQETGWRQTVGPSTLIPADAPTLADFFVRFRCLGQGLQEMVIDDIELLLI